MDGRRWLHLLGAIHGYGPHCFIIAISTYIDGPSPCLLAEYPMGWDDHDAQNGVRVVRSGCCLYVCIEDGESE